MQNIFIFALFTKIVISQKKKEILKEIFLTFVSYFLNILSVLRAFSERCKSKRGQIQAAAHQKHKLNNRLMQCWYILMR